MPTWVFFIAGLILPPITNTEISSLLLFADSVYYKGYYLNRSTNLWDVSIVMSHHW